MTFLVVNDLRLYYSSSRGVVRAVDDVSLEVERGTALAIVGESGCGKSSLAAAIMRLLPKNVHTYSGEILLDGVNIVDVPEEEFRQRYRWRRIAMVFQGAMNALNPVIDVGRQIAEPLEIHQGLSRREALERSVEALRVVKLPEYVARRYPHELSGGMKQRVVIAMALIMKPDLLILDEPTSALDVITQASVMNLLKRLKEELEMTYIFITHDIALASEIADRIGVLYAGRLIELGSAEQVILDPKHPYSQKLIASIPSLRGEKKLEYIPGSPPDLVNPPSGCRFHPRCPYVMEICREEPSEIVMEGRHVKCWLYERRQASVEA